MLSCMHAKSAQSALDRVRWRVNNLLDRQKLSQRKLAKHVGTDSTSMSRLLSGKRGIKVSELDSIAEFLKVPVAELLRAPDDRVYELRADEAEVVDRYRGLPSPGQEALLTLFSYLIQKPVPAGGAHVTPARSSRRRSAIAAQEALDLIARALQVAAEAKGAADRAHPHARKTPPREPGGHLGD